jgi:hypothetical protein
VEGAQESSIYQSTNLPILSTLYEPLSKQLISVLVGMGLLYGYEVRIQAIDGGAVTIEALP